MNRSRLEAARLEEIRQARGTAEALLAGRDGRPEWEVRWLGDDGAVACFAGTGHWYNQAVGLGLHGPVDEAIVDEAIEFFESRGAEARFVVATPADPSLLAALAVRSFVAREFEHVLMRELADPVDPHTEHPHGWPDGLRLEHLDAFDDEAVVRFTDLATSGFRPEGAPVEPWMLDTTRAVVQHEGSDAYTAWLDGEAVGGGSMESRAPAAALFGASVLPSARRRGVQAALILERARRARERGCAVVAIQSGPGIPTERNAARVGFELAYAKVNLVRPGPGLVPSP